MTLYPKMQKKRIGKNITFQEKTILFIVFYPKNWKKRYTFRQKTLLFTLKCHKKRVKNQKRPYFASKMTKIPIKVHIQRVFTPKSAMIR